MKYSLSILFIAVFSLLGCQKDPTRTDGELQKESGVQLVQAEDGSLYSVDCLRENAQAISQSGSSAMNHCKMVVTVGNTGQTRIQAGKFFTNSSYSWIFYPPTYWGSNYSSNYGSSYNPYSDSNYSNNLFCAYIFGGNYNFNCYYLFGYTNYSNYSNSYNPSCNYCLYAPHPNKCRNRCYRYDYYWTY